MKTKLSKALSLILAFVLCFSATIPVFAADEIPEGYTPIYTAEDLNNIRNNLSGSYILMNDIDLSVYENWEPIGSKETPFAGTLDGKNHSIDNLRIYKTLNSENAHDVGLFGYVSGGTIKNTAMAGVDINVYWEGETADYYEFKAAALVAELKSGKIISCAVLGDISVNGFEKCYVGAMSGYNISSEIRCCSNYADITVSTNNEAIVGGIAGHLDIFSAIYESCNKAKISIIGKESEAESVVGGIYGSSYSVLSSENLYNHGTVSIDSPNGYIGGLAGDTSILVNCYNIGEIITADGFLGYIGGLAGNLNEALIFGPGMPEYPRIENAYYNDSTLAPSYFNMDHFDEFSADEKQFAFINTNCVTSEQMKNQTLYTTFNFDNIWTMEEGGYPVLQNQPTLMIKESLDIEKGETYVPKSFEIWKSTDETVATVNEDGEIVALSAGTATVTIEHAYGFYTEYTITVTDSTITPEPDPEPEPTPDPEPPTDPEPEPTCWLIKIINLIKRVWSFVVNTIKSFF